MKYFKSGGKNHLYWGGIGLITISIYQFIQLTNNLISKAYFQMTNPFELFDSPNIHIFTYS